MSEDDLDQAAEEIHDLFDDVRDALAEDLGGDPDDYRSDRTIPDGGE